MFCQNVGISLSFLAYVSREGPHKFRSRALHELNSALGMVVRNQWANSCAFLKIMHFVVFVKSKKLGGSVGPLTRIAMSIQSSYSTPSLNLTFLGSPML